MHIKCGFEKLYSKELSLSPLSSLVSSFSCYFLFDENCSSISSMVTDEEVRANLWSLKPFKAPGPNRLHAGFLQHSRLKWVALYAQRLRESLIQR